MSDPGELVRVTQQPQAVDVQAPGQRPGVWVDQETGAYYTNERSYPRLGDLPGVEEAAIGRGLRLGRTSMKELLKVQAIQDAVRKIRGGGLRYTRNKPDYGSRQEIGDIERALVEQFASIREQRRGPTTEEVRLAGLRGGGVEGELPLANLRGEGAVRQPSAKDRLLAEDRELMARMGYEVPPVPEEVGIPIEAQLAGLRDR